MLIYYVSFEYLDNGNTIERRYDTQDGKLIEVIKHISPTPAGYVMKGAHKDIYKASDGRRNAGEHLA